MWLVTRIPAFGHIRTVWFRTASTSKHFDLRVSLSAIYPVREDQAVVCKQSILSPLISPKKNARSVGITFLLLYNIQQWSLFVSELDLCELSRTFTACSFGKYGIWFWNNKQSIWYKQVHSRGKKKSVGRFSGNNGPILASGGQNSSHLRLQISHYFVELFYWPLVSYSCFN